MTNPNYTDITIILDESGSMLHTTTATIEGFNGMVDEQIQLNKKYPHLFAKLSVYKFNSQVRKVYDDLDIRVRNLEILSLDKWNYKPEGSTSLLDAIGRAVNETGARLSALRPAERPGNVMFIIMSDGEENSSRYFSYQQINDLITQQRDTYNWSFKFIGTDQDVIATAAKLGLQAKDSRSFSNTTKGYKIAYTGMSSMIGSTRTGGAEADWEEDHK